MFPPLDNVLDKVSDVAASVGVIVGAVGATLAKAAHAALKGGHKVVALWVPATFEWTPKSTANRLINVGFIKGDLAVRLGGVAKFLSHAGNALSIGITLFNSLKDGELSVGDGAAIILAVASAAVPAFGFIYGAVDLLVKAFSNKDPITGKKKGLTDRIKDFFDGRYKKTLKLWDTKK